MDARHPLISIIVLRKIQQRPSSSDGRLLYIAPLVKTLVIMQPKATFRQNEIMYYAMLAAQLLIALMMRFVLIQPDHSSSDDYSVIIPIILGVGIAMSFFFRNRAADTIPLTGTPTEKLNHYRRYLILQAAILEGCNLIIILLAMMDNNPRSFLWFVPGILVFLTLRPNKLNFLNDYQLSQTDLDRLEE